MKILIDSQIFDTQNYGGISRYYTQIIENLNEDITVPIFVTENVYFNQSKIITNKQKTNKFFTYLLSKIGISFRKKIKKKNSKLMINALKKQDYDLFIPTYYNPYFLEYIGNKPFVLTVYDMIHELFPNYFNDAYIIIKNKCLLIERATKIIAVSENTKKDILKIYPRIDQSKIEVIYHGNSITINQKIKVKLPENYILFVGSRENYKNFNFLINAIIDLLKKDVTLKILCAGGGKFTNKEIEFLENLEIRNQVIQLNFEENQLGIFYKKAKCFVFPSSYEGFGIPVLESMACGCPIILTNFSSFPEVAGNAGIYFELNDEKDLKNKIEVLLENESMRKEYSLRGLEHIKKFNWHDAANQCLKVYQDTINIIDETI